MAEIDNQILSIENDTQNANKVKDLVITSLFNQGLLSKEDAYDYVERFHVMIYKGSWFKRFFDKYVKNDGNKNINGYYYRVVELQEKKPLTLNELT